MTTADGCTAAALTCEGRVYATFPHGEDPGWRSTQERCGDCGARRGHNHHLGCDIQVCPRCRRQLITCGCQFDEYHDEPDPDDELDAVGELAGDERWRGPDEESVLDLEALFARASASSEPVEAQPLVPMAEASEASRQTHRELLRSVSADALARGRTLDLDVAAACLDALARHLGAYALPLHRPTVASLLMTQLLGWGSMRQAILPRTWVGDLWTVLVAVEAEGLLHPRSDPLSALLEPLACAAGVGLDGEPMDPGTDVDFACQCFVPFDPTLPEGFGRLLVAERPEDGWPLFAIARLLPRSSPPDPSDLLPWLNVVGRTPVPRSLELHAEPLLLGAVPAGRRHPELWLYQPTHRSTPGEFLSLDHDGNPHRVQLDRRFKEGYRWVRERSDVMALATAGFFVPRPRSRR